jgi:hypothetical protein
MRIRSIKPEFWTSEAIAVLPVSARLTFIGLWSYVDDNGVGKDNDRLIMGALYPLDERPSNEVLGDLQDDLRRLSGAALVVRYTDSDGHPFLSIRSWSEHQRISHPRKSRFPLPGDPGCVLTCDSREAPEDFRSDSGGYPVSLRREQGAGSREQGEPLPPVPARKRTPRTTPEHPEFARFYELWPRHVARAEAVRAFDKAAAKVTDPADISRGAYRFAQECKRLGTAPDKIPYPASWLNGERWNDAPTPLTGRAAAPEWMDESAAAFL